MKKKKKGGRLFTMIIALIMLFSSMTAYAETPEKPEKKDAPKWEDVYELMDYVGQNVYDVVGDNFFEEVDKELPYRKKGTLLAGVSEEKAYAAYVEGNGAFAEENHQDGEIELTGDAKNQYEDFYKAAIALVRSVKEADGTNYVEDILDEYYDFLKNTVRPLEEKLENEQIIRIVSSEEEAPDTASMAKGTYWVLSDHVETFGNAMTAAYGQNWPRDDKDRITSTRAEVETFINSVKKVYNTLISNLHEGTIETAAPAESLKEVSSVSAASYKDEVSETPALVNEVMYAGGTKEQSTLEGVYCKTFTAGTIYTDEPQKIMQAAGLSEKEIADGVVIKYFICTSRNKEMNKMLTGTVSEQGYKVLGIMNNDLYKLAKGTITKIKSTGEEISVVLGIPENLRSDQYEFVVMCYDENGALVVMPDLDSDRATITVRAKCFGYWAVGYRVRQ